MDNMEKMQIVLQTLRTFIIYSRTSLPGPWRKPRLGTKNRKLTVLATGPGYKYNKFFSFFSGLTQSASLKSPFFISFFFLDLLKIELLSL